MSTKKELLAFNRGIVSELGLGRVDLDRVGLSASQQYNFVPRVLGSMMFRPGMGYINNTHQNRPAYHLGFQFSVDDNAILELTDNIMRVEVDDQLLVREDVDSATTNGEFLTDLSDWDDFDESGTVSIWADSDYFGSTACYLVGDGTNESRRRQEVTVAVGDQGIPHALRIKVDLNPVTIRIGSTSGGDEYLREATYGVGEHSLVFTPLDNFHIQLANKKLYGTRISSIQIEDAGIFEINTPWKESDFSLIRTWQSGDVIFAAKDGDQQNRIERRLNGSWSVVKYYTTDGPWRLINVSTTRMKVDDLSGETVLTADKPVFTTDDIGAIFKLESKGQIVEKNVDGEDQWSDYIRVTGTFTQHKFKLKVANAANFTGVIQLQYSAGNPGAWVDWTENGSPWTYVTNNGTYNYDIDPDDGRWGNQILYFRVGIKVGDYTQGNSDLTLNYESGSITGICRAYGYDSATKLQVTVLKTMGNREYTDDWYEGAWSPRRGWPTAVSLFESRLWWAGRDKIYGSETDLYDSFSDEAEGDAKPISRSIGAGPIRSIHWLLPLGRIVFGTAHNSKNLEALEINGNNVLSGRSSSFDEALTATNFNIKTAGAAGIFVDRSGTRLYEVSMRGSETIADDYLTEDLNVLTPDLNEAGIKRIAVQFKPDMRFHVIRNDGTASMVVYDAAENVLAWLEIKTDGIIEDVVILPGSVEDQVYYCVARTINGETVRFREKWAMENEAIGGSITKLSDAHITYDGASTDTITGLDHLEGREVTIWADGKDCGTATVSGGSITLSDPASQVVVGLAYDGFFKSTKLSKLDFNDVRLGERRIIGAYGLVLQNTHHLGLRIGTDPDNMSDLPQQVKGRNVDEHEIFTQLDDDETSFDGVYDSDTRICLAAASPRPAGVKAVSVWMKSDDKRG